MKNEIYETTKGLSPAAKMMGILHGGRVYKGRKRIEKWEFNAEVQNGRVIHNDCVIDDLVIAANLLVEDRLRNYSFVKK